MRKIILLALLQACATNSSQTIELSPSGKQDGAAFTDVTLDPKEEVTLIWSCEELLELNGCTTDVEIWARGGDIPDGAWVASLLHSRDDGEDPSDTRIFHGDNKVTFESPAFSIHEAELINTSTSTLVFGILAAWR